MPVSRLITVLRHPLAAFFGSRTGRAAGSDWIGLDRRRVFILPTRTGLGFAVLLLVMLLGAINYSNNLIFALTFLLAGLGVVAMLHTYRNLVNLQLQAGQGRPGFVGETLGFQVWLRAGDGRPRQALELRSMEGDTAIAEAGSEAVSVWLHRPATHRGANRLGRVTVSSRFPLGLFRAWSHVDFAHTELAYPTPAPPGPPPPETAGTPAPSGDLYAGADDFRGLRHYRPGDSLRQIHWKALARGQDPLTKEFGTAGTPLCWLDIAAAPEPDVEARLRRLCRWVLDAERGQVCYGLRLPGQSWPPARGDAHRDRCLAALARFGEPA
jgi:uncharacterized protein (DUF58 family)